MASAPNWDAIKAEYIASDISQRQLAEKYGIPPGTVAKRAQQQGWKRLRDECVSKSSEKVVQKLADERAELARKGLEIGSQLADLSKQILANLKKGGLSRASADGSEMDMLKTIQAWATMAKTLGVDEESIANRDRLQLEREKLQIEKERSTTAGTEEMPTIVINLGNDDQRE